MLLPCSSLHSDASRVMRLRSCVCVCVCVSGMRFMLPPCPFLLLCVYVCTCIEKKIPRLLCVHLCKCCVCVCVCVCLFVRASKNFHNSNAQMHTRMDVRAYIRVQKSQCTCLSSVYCLRDVSANVFRINACVYVRVYVCRVHFSFHTCMLLSAVPAATMDLDSHAWKETNVCIVIPTCKCSCPRLAHAISNEQKNVCVQSIFTSVFKSLLD
jgi:hypothetical protein